MYISNITLRNWKCYAHASLDFPAPLAGKNIILIGARNGYGKTSLFEAIVLGIFGRDGLPLIARSPFSVSDKEPLATSYKKFLEAALHRTAIDTGCNSCSVKLTFVDDKNEIFEIERIWHFTDTGAYRPQDEEVHVFEGSPRRPVGPTGDEVTFRREWYRDYISSTFLPYYLAAFFLFDGEQVSAFAGRDMAGQVRIGIEGLLGIPVLKNLAEDLRSYAQARRRESPNVSDKTVEKLEQERDLLKAQFDDKQKRYAEIEPDLARRKEERDLLTRELASFGSASQAQLQEQLEQLNHYRHKVETARTELEELLARDIALALSGRGLRKTLKARLVSEGVRERWQNGKSQGDQNLERFISAIDEGMNSINPKLTDGQRRCVLEAARSAWEQLWFPPPENCAEDYLHPYLNDLERGKVIERLDEIDQLTAPAIIDLLNTIAISQKELEQLQHEIMRTEALAPNIDKKRQRLTVLNEQIQAFDQEVGALRREIEALDSQIKQKDTELAKLASQWDQAKPSVRRATRALKVANMIDEIVEKVVPSQINALANAMTEAYRSMAHKKDLVDRIEIDENCDVKLLTKEGIDVRQYDLSAGEKQIFTQALISAVSSVSGRRFPMVVDTPLGRLDVHHRKGVLNYLAKRQHQVILLSTDTEVVGEYLEEISQHVQRKFLIQFERVGEIGRSTFTRGYFQEDEVPT